MNIHLSAGLQITVALPTAQSQARNVCTNHKRTTGDEPVTTTVALIGFTQVEQLHLNVVLSGVLMSSALKSTVVK